MFLLIRFIHRHVIELTITSILLKFLNLIKVVFHIRIGFIFRFLFIILYVNVTSRISLRCYRNQYNELDSLVDDSIYFKINFIIKLHNPLMKLYFTNNKNLLDRFYHIIFGIFLDFYYA